MISKIIRVIKRVIFSILYSGSFRAFGKSTLISFPCRFDGSNNIEIGNNTLIQKGIWLYAVGINNKDSKLKIGNKCVLGYNNHITCVRSVNIGDSVLTANNVYISDNLHSYQDIKLPIINQPILFKNSVSIGSGSWIGENVSIIGASIGKNCVIGANSVVTRDIPDYSVAVGIPARVIKKFNPKTNYWEIIKLNNGRSL